MATFKIRNRNKAWIDVESKNFTRGGTKSPTMTIFVRKRDGHIITPYEFKVYQYSIDLNNAFKMVYGDELEKLIPSQSYLFSYLPKEKGFSSPYHVPVILGKEHGVV